MQKGVSLPKRMFNLSIPSGTTSQKPPCLRLAAFFLATFAVASGRAPYAPLSICVCGNVSVSLRIVGDGGE